MKSLSLYLLLALLLILISVSISINIYPELFFYPWLVAKGLIPYKDFFDHHGFLLYYLLAPFSKDLSLMAIKIVFITVQLINFSLIWVIIRKNQSLLVSFLLGFLYILLNIMTVENTIWYEQFILIGYLLIYLFTFYHRFSYRQVLIGALVILVSFIKPTALIIIFPLLLLRYWQTALTVIIGWLSFMIYLHLHSLLQPFIQNVFIFNSQFSHYLLTHYSLMGDKRFLVVTLLFLSTLIFFHLRYSRTIKSLITLLMVFSCLFFLYPTYDRKHLVPIISFIVVYASSLSFKANVTARNYVLIISSFICLSLFFVIPQFHQLQKRLAYVDENPQTLSINKPFYILGNNVELYYRLDQLPPTYYPLLLPGFTIAAPGIETKIIKDIEKRSTQYIAVPLSLNSNYRELTQLKGYIFAHYTVYQVTPQFQILKRIQ